MGKIYLDEMVAQLIHLKTQQSQFHEGSTMWNALEHDIQELIHEIEKRYGGDAHHD